MRREKEAGFGGAGGEGWDAPKVWGGLEREWDLGE